MTTNCNSCGCPFGFEQFEYARGVGMLDPLCIRCWWLAEGVFQEKLGTGIEPIKPEGPIYKNEG